MNDAQFKHHLKDLAHGHHHPEEHDWNHQATGGKAPPKNAAKSTPKAAAKRKAPSRKK